ncbi:MAG TPA: nucleotide sugar dehydrogenase [Thermomicrobiales bacterium]|jgi:UDP-N-acetyl-D-glucosamine dehydrogenase
MVAPLLKDEAAVPAVRLVRSLASTLREDILSRRARVAIVGLGYVGLPLGTAFAEARFNVTGYDVDPQRVAAINAGHSHIGDVPSSQIAWLVETGMLRATSDSAELVAADVVVICVPTPLTDAGEPDLRYVTTAVDRVAASLRRGQLVILESTTYPGTTRDVVLPMLERSGLTVGRDVFLAFSPERVDPGNPKYGITNTPKVTGGIDAESTSLAALFYRQAIERVVSVSTPEAAEMVKLLENTFRSVNIALANEMAVICDRLGIDVWEVIGAASTKPFGFMPFYPGPGVGGHCIPLDPLYLSWKMKTLDVQTRFIDLASAVNHERPHYVVRRTEEALAAHGRTLAAARILVLGVAYKPDIDDARESPALDVIAELARAGAHVAYADPHVPTITAGGVAYTHQPPTADRLQRADCVLLITNHRAFDYSFIAHHARLIVDTRNAFKGAAVGYAALVRL